MLGGFAAKIVFRYLKTKVSACYFLQPCPARWRVTLSLPKRGFSLRGLVLITHRLILTPLFAEERGDPPLAIGVSQPTHLK